MTTVTIVIPTGRLPQQMTRMRFWLDQQRCQPSVFASEGRPDGSVLCHVTFADPEDAEAFAARFGEVCPQEG